MKVFARRGLGGTTSTTSQSEPAATVTTEAEPDTSPGSQGQRTDPVDAAPDGPDAAAGARPDETEPPEKDTPPQEAPPPPRRRGPLWAKALIAVGTVIVLLSVGTIVTVRVLATRYDKTVTRAPLLDPGVRVQPDPNNGLVAMVGPLNFLLLGSDARDNDPSNGQRSDTIILVHVPASMDRAYLISIPRDLRVHIPENPQTQFSGSTEKVNAAFNYGGGGIGGFQLLSKTLNQLIGIKFDGAGIINFDGFQRAVNVLGGIDLCVDQETKSIHTGAVYQPGCQHLRPWQALDYVRQRELLPGGDYDRQRHQQQFLKALFENVLNQGIATNPVKLDQLIRAIGSSLTLDTGGVSLPEMVFSLKNIKPSSLVGIKVPSYPTMLGDTSYVLPYDQAASLYQAIASDTLDSWVTANSSWVNTI
jgi:LCP family protein required for cell wall assembly